MSLFKPTPKKPVKKVNFDSGNKRKRDQPEPEVFQEGDVFLKKLFTYDTTNGWLNPRCPFCPPDIECEFLENSQLDGQFFCSKHPFWRIQKVPVSKSLVYETKSGKTLDLSDRAQIGSHVAGLRVPLVRKWLLDCQETFGRADELTQEADLIHGFSKKPFKPRRKKRRTNRRYQDLDDDEFDEELDQAEEDQIVPRYGNCYLQVVVFRRNYDDEQCAARTGLMYNKQGEETKFVQIRNLPKGDDFKVSNAHVTKTARMVSMKKIFLLTFFYFSGTYNIIRMAVFDPLINGIVVVKSGHINLKCRNFCRSTSYLVMMFMARQPGNAVLLSWYTDCSNGRLPTLAN